MGALWIVIVLCGAWSLFGVGDLISCLWHGRPLECWLWGRTPEEAIVLREREANKVLAEVDEPLAIELGYEPPPKPKPLTKVPSLQDALTSYRPPQMISLLAPPVGRALSSGSHPETVEPEEWHYDAYNDVYRNSRGDSVSRAQLLERADRLLDPHRWR